MAVEKLKLSSKIIERCQISGSKKLNSILFLGFVTPVNQMKKIGQRPKEDKMYPLELLYCPESYLVQIGYEVDPSILFPLDYPYTSGTTKILRDNFKDLYLKVKKIIKLSKDSLIIDIGSNDGTLLSNFVKGGHQVLGIDPTNKTEIANNNGIRSKMAFFNKKNAENVLEEFGKAELITAANVFAHMQNINEIIEGIKLLLKKDGLFISESHYLLNLIQTLQFDTIYHEHLRYYSLHSLDYLFKKHGMEIIKVEKIPTHGGSIRVYTTLKGVKKIDRSVNKILQEEKNFGLLKTSTYYDFSINVMKSKLNLLKLLQKLRSQGHKIYGIGAPSRASTLINYIGLDHLIIDCVLEINGSHKIGKYMPGTLIPVLNEDLLYSDQPGYALLFSWHISNELISNLKKKGFKGKFIIPLPTPNVVK